MTMEMTTTVSGRLVLDDRVVGGSITVEDRSIAAVDLSTMTPLRTARSSRRGSWTSTSTAGAATTRWVAATRSTAWPGACCGAA